MWNTQSLDDSAHFLLIDQEITGLTQTLATTNQVVNTVSGVATGAAGASVLNTQAIATLNNTTIPPLVSSNILQIQNYINSNSFQDNLSFYISSNTVNNFINFYISSNILNKQNYINSNSLQDDLSFYISSNILNKQNHINSCLLYTSDAADE